MPSLLLTVAMEYVIYMLDTYVKLVLDSLGVCSLLAQANLVVLY